MMVLIHIRVSTLMACAPMPASPPLRAFLEALLKISSKEGAGFLTTSDILASKAVARTRFGKKSR